MLSLISLRISLRPAPWTISRFVIFVHHLQNNYKIKIPISLLVFYPIQIDYYRYLGELIISNNII